MIAHFIRQWRRELVLSMRQIQLLFNACLFFLMVIVFFPLTMRPDTIVLRAIAPGLIWVAMLFAMLLSSERLFQQDYDDGVIEQWIVSGDPLTLFITAKLSAHWLSMLLPILILCPLLAILFALTSYETIILMLSLVCGTPAMFCLCSLAAAFSTGIKQKGVLMALILLPLTIPVMIFGSGVLISAMQGLNIAGYLALLSAISLIAIACIPFAIGGIIAITLV